MYFRMKKCLFLTELGNEKILPCKEIKLCEVAMENWSRLLSVLVVAGANGQRQQCSGSFPPALISLRSEELNEELSIISENTNDGHLTHDLLTCQLFLLASEDWMKNLHSRSPQSILPLSLNQLTINKLFLSQIAGQRLSLAGYAEHRLCAVRYAESITRFEVELNTHFRRSTTGRPVQFDC